MSKKEETLDPRVIRTRKLLRDALLDLIPEKGYNAITIGDIAKRATLNRVTFYLHYRDKDDLLLTGIEEILDELTAKIPIPSLKNQKITVKESTEPLVQVFDHLAENATFYKVMLGEDGVPVFRDKVHEYIQQLASYRLNTAVGEIANLPIPVDIVINYVTAAWVGVFQWWLENEMPYPPQYMATQLTKLTVYGIFQLIGIDVLSNGNDSMVS